MASENIAEEGVTHPPRLPPSTMYGLWGVQGNLIASGLTLPVVSIVAFVTLLGLSVFVDSSQILPEGATAELGLAALLW